MNREFYEAVFSKVLEMTDDGFIVVDPKGIIVNINEQYAQFLLTSRDEAIGKSIFSLIPNSLMLEIMQKKYTDELEVHTYESGTSQEKNVIVSRSYVEGEDSEVIAGVAQVKFRLQSLDVARKLKEEYETLSYYRDQYHDQTSAALFFNNMIGEDPFFLQQKKEGMKIAQTHFPVLIQGETGTGKELYAQGIHSSSPRANMPMVSINCAAIPTELMESELFSYVDGAFTGAKKGGKKGKFLLADNGTLFLDEIGDMPLNMQAKLLRALQEQEIEPIGSNTSIPVDIRVISATRKNLSQMVQEGSFREDLFYRLNVVNIEMIPLRKRPSDILLLAEYFVELLNEQYKRHLVIGAEVKEAFKAYSWPGNVRELDNVIKSAYAVCDRDVISLSDIPPKIMIAQTGSDQNHSTLKSAMEEYEKKWLQTLLIKHHWNVRAAAKEAGIHRSVLYKKLDRHNLERP